MTLSRLLVLLIVAAAIVFAAAARLLSGPSITVNEWRNAPAGSDLGVVFDEPSHPPWNW